MGSTGRIVFAGLVAVPLSACNGTVVLSPSAPTATVAASAASPAATVSIVQPAGRQTSLFVGAGCMVGSHVTPTFGIGITAVSTIDINHVTVQMNDGTHLGGPAVTFPGATVAQQFGTVRLVAGTTRSFIAQPDVACGATPWRAVSVGVGFQDLGGASHVVTASLPLQ
jgi:hypothetical protein